MSKFVTGNNKKKAVVMGAGGFIGGHLVTRLKNDGYWVRAVDIKWHEYKNTDADEFIVADLRDRHSVDLVVDDTIDEVYQLAADMGGALFVFTGDNDSDIMHNSATINLNVCEACVEKGVKKVFYSSSACMYPEYNQLDPQNPKCSEDSAYPAGPDSEYGWEKLFSERLYLAYLRNKGLDVRVARFHNIYGPYGTWCGGREKAPAAMLRKVCEANEGDSIEVWGDGLQTRSFLLVDECVEGVIRLMNSDFVGPVNIGSEEMVTINELAQMAIDISGKNLTINNIDVPHTGVRGRNSDNALIKEKLGWEPTMSLLEGMKLTYKWIKEQVDSK
jgi:GDP-D-mannose 3', 5'-epimerase